MKTTMREYTNIGGNKMDSTSIIEGALKAAEGTNLRACIKQSVYAAVVTAEGNVYYGANWMTNADVTICPRVTDNCPSGHGYERCVDVCQQTAHAERYAMAACIAAGDTVVGSMVYVTGHTCCCKYCIAAMSHALVKGAYVIDSGAAYIF